MRLAAVPPDAKGVSVALVPSLDETKRTGTLSLDGVRVAPGDRLEAAPGEATVEFLANCGAVAVTAEGLGAAEGALA